MSGLLWMGLSAIALLLPAHSASAAGEKTLNSDLTFNDCTIGSGAATLVAQCATLPVLLYPSSLQDLTSGSLNGAPNGTPKSTPNGTKNGSLNSTPNSNINGAVNNDALATDLADARAEAGAGKSLLELSIARIPARRQSSRTDAFTLIAGGPGQSAIESFPSVAFAFRHIMRDYDVILIDQRGTGGSSKLACQSAPDSLGLEFDRDTAKLTELAQECRQSLAHDPALFTTSVAVRDLEQVRETLGVSQWNMYGVSYGTRVALHYLRRFPDAVRTLTLDAVVPPSVSLGPDIGALAQRSLDDIFERCRADAGCHDAFGYLAEPVMALLDRLENEPLTLTFEDVVTGKLRTMEFTRQHLAATLRLLSYNAQTAAILPSMLHDAIVNGNFAPFARQALLQTRSLGDSLATGMHHAVICTEDAPFVDADPAIEPVPSYLGDAIVSSLLASCKQWPPGLMDEDFKAPFSSTVPTLILSGDADPITPPQYGEIVAQQFSQSRHIVNAHQGHMQAPLGCLPVLLAQFVNTGNALGLETACLQRLNAPPFFVDANGPLP